ncbi:MAG: FAD-dependent oxidoreductase [Thermodesulfobacteriota bacterium]
MEHQKLFSPLTINGLTIPNRIVMPSMGLGYTYDFSLNDRVKAFYRARALGGVGLMTIGPVAIDTQCMSPVMPGLFEDGQIPPFKEFIDEIHRTTAARVAIQLMHMGRNAILFNGEEAIAPSPIPGKMNRQAPREMTRDDILMVIDHFARAAARAREAGFDFIEIIGCTGYLISQFLSPLTNVRTDEYGGCLENRMRFGLEVIRGVREAVGNGMPLGIRIAGNDFMDGGNTNREAALFAAEAEKAGVNAINVTGGWHETYIPQLTTPVPPGAFVYLARGIKESVSVPVFASNRLGNPDVAEKALRDGSCDMVCWGRPLIADPELPNKVRQKRFDEITPCIACNQGCFDQIITGAPVCCVLNPMAGREAEFTIQPAGRPKTIAVAGGGPAGMEFAVMAASRGHQVTLYESGDKLGGQVNLAKASPGKEEIGNIIKSLEKRMKKAGVRIRLNTPLDRETLTAVRPDLLVVATGAKPVEVNVPGIDKPHVVSAWDVLSEKVWDIGENVVIIGGSATGCETAHFVAALGAPDAATCAFLMYHHAEDEKILNALMHKTGKKITVIDMVDRLAANVGRTSRWVLVKSLKLSDVTMMPGTRLVEITDDAVIVQAGEERKNIPADTVILALGAKPNDTLSAQGKALGIDTIVIGDAKAPRKISDAVFEGFEAGLKV